MNTAKTRTLRTWLSPLTSVLFLVTGLSGILMMFHLRPPGVTVLHEIGGILFVLFAVLHLKINWQPLLTCCKKRAGRVALFAGVVAAALILIVGTGHDEEHERGSRIHGRQSDH